MVMTSHLVPDEPADCRPFAPRRLRFEALIVAAGLVIQVGITLLAARHQPERRDTDVFGVALLALGVAALPLRSRWPVAVLAFTFVTTLGYWTADYGRGPVFYSLVVALAQVVWTGHRPPPVVGGIRLLYVAGPNARHVRSAGHRWCDRARRVVGHVTEHDGTGPQPPRTGA